MPSRKMKGRLLEYAVRRKLRSLGYYVFRCAGSRPVDLIAMKEGKTLLIECKAGLNPHLTLKQQNHILDIAKKIYKVNRCWLSERNIEGSDGSS